MTTRLLEMRFAADPKRLKMVRERVHEDEPLLGALAAAARLGWRDRRPSTLLFARRGRARVARRGRRRRRRPKDGRVARGVQAPVAAEHLQRGGTQRHGAFTCAQR